MMKAAILLVVLLSVYVVKSDHIDEMAGFCPLVQPHEVGTCVEACDSDADCAGETKCCSNGCGHVCKDPVVVSCPAISHGEYGGCVEKCDDQVTCERLQLCCSNGCGHVCVDIGNALGGSGGAAREVVSPLLVILASCLMLVFLP